MNSYALPLSKAFADELTNHVKSLGHGWKHMHSFELIAAFHGFKSAAALKASGLLESARYPDYGVNIDESFAADRASQLGIDPESTAAAIQKLHELYDEEHIPSISLAKRLERDIAYNCEMDPQWGYVGAALLDEDDWRACGDIASSDGFVDYMYTANTYSAISVIATAYADPSYEGLYQANPDAVLNIVAFLKSQL